MAKILIVDDDSLMVRMYQTKFTTDGNFVENASDGDVGFNKVIEFKPDLILLDVMMPKINGLEFLKKIKATEETKSIPVVILTNMGGSEDVVQKALDLGAVSYLIKAEYTPKEVVEKVKEILAGYVMEIPKVKTKIKV